MTLRKQISKFIESMGADHQLFRFLYNMNIEEFKPGKDTVCYGGPYWDEQEMVSIFEALMTGKWITSGEHVHQFEARFSKKFNLNHSLMVNSGSSANLVMISTLKKYLGWHDNDEVILSVVVFPTTLSVLIQNNLKPVLVDITQEDLNFDIGAIEAKITPKTRAIFLSPVLGNPPDMDRLVELCVKHQIQLVLDNCDSLGSRWNDHFLSDYAVASSCSFYPAHHICTGEGGMVSSDNEDIVKLARSFAWWGRDCYCVGSANLLPHGTCGNRFDCWLKKHDGIIDHKYLFANIGYNLKPLDLQGAIGKVQIEKFDTIHSKRRQYKKQIQNMFEEYVSGVRIISELIQAETSWFAVPVYCETPELKERLVAYLESKKIQTRHYFAGNVLMHPAFEQLGNSENYPQANEVLKRVFFIGCSPTYNESILEYVDTVLRHFKHMEARGSEEPVALSA